jgi:hypothetical protein
MIKKHFFIAEAIFGLGLDYIWISGDEKLINQTLIDSGVKIKFYLIIEFLFKIYIINTT